MASLRILGLVGVERGLDAGGTRDGLGRYAGVENRESRVESAELHFESVKIKCLFCSTADLELGVWSSIKTALEKKVT